MATNRAYKETEKYGSIPKIHIERSIFDESHSHKTTFENGRIIPIYVDPDILPGDTIEMDCAEVIRMSTPIFPVMDNAFADIMFFSVPIRLLWEHWEEFWGYNKSEWTQQTEYEIPQITAPEGGWAEKTLADYMGIPTKIDNISISALPARAYTKIYNDWFRDENLQKESHLYTDDTARVGKNTDNSITDLELYGQPAKAAKIHDYFTSALPAPQKGPTVNIPLGEKAPVTATGEPHEFNNNSILWKIPGGQLSQTGIHDVGIITTDTPGIYGTRVRTVAESPQYDNQVIAPVNLWADLNDATAASISALRMAFQLQRYYEAQARSGSRYIEFIRGIFGVDSSDARLQRSEFLGGIRFQINMDQIIQTSSSDQISPQGNAAGFSVTARKDSMFTKSFEEHSILIGICVCRTERTYQQGIPRAFSRLKKTDFYNPYFAHLSEQPIFNKEIYAQGTTTDEEVFGYQEAWGEYRYKQSRVSGSMRSNAESGSLDAYHYADDYESLPTLSSEWIVEPTENVARTLTVIDTKDQYIADFYFKARYVRPMPVYGIPGLIDHV